MNLSERPSIPTSVALEQLLLEAPQDSISLGWILSRLQDRSFGLLMLVLALVGLAPGVASFSGFFLAIPAIQMVMGRASPVLPRRLVERTVPTRHFARWVRRAIPFFRYVEANIPAGLRAPAWATTRLIGILDLVLAIMIILPIPFAYIVPTLAIVLISFAQIEESGLLFLIATVGALGSLSFTAALVWSIVKATGLIAAL